MALRVILIGNYPHDAQESMQRFAAMMSDGLRAAGVSVELMIPPPVFGRLKESGHGLGKWLGYIDKFILFPFLLRRRLRKIRNQVVVHLCDHSNAFYTRFLQDVPHVVTCHDLLAVRSALGEIPENPTRWSGRQLQNMVVRGLGRARQMVCDSEATAQDVHRLIALPKDRVSVISVGFNYPYSPMPEPEACARIAAMFDGVQSPPITDHRSPISTFRPPRFILHVGGNQWYKNRLGVLRIYAGAVAANPATPDLVMAGKPFTPEMEAFVAANQLQERVRCVEGCSNEDLRALYSVAELLLFPSLAEGFGWPVIEAQACGCPVLCSSIEPFPEVTRGTAGMHAPADEPGFTSELLRLLARPDDHQNLTAQGLANALRFAPAAMIASYIECYQQLTKKQEERLPASPAPRHRPTSPHDLPDS